MTDLHEACRKGNLRSVKKLIEKGAKVNKSDKRETTPLGIASREGHLEVVQYLESKGAK